MSPAYAPKTPTGRLDRLIEEIGEVSVEAGALLKAIAKARRFGPHGCHPAGGATNLVEVLSVMDRLRVELADLADAILFVEADVATGGLDGFYTVEAAREIGA